MFVTRQYRLDAISIRSRLWVALALLALSTMLVGGVAWLTLDETDHELENLHSQTLAGVATAIRLSTRSADMASSAPFLLNFGSVERIRQEGEVLVAAISESIDRWKSASQAPSSETVISTVFSDAMIAMRQSIRELIEVAITLEMAQENVVRVNTVTTALRDRISNKIEDSNVDRNIRLNWISLQFIANTSISAGYSRNHLDLGEIKRSYNKRIREIRASRLTAEQELLLQDIRTSSEGVGGIFSLRSQELKLTLVAKNALFLIRQNANAITDLTGTFAREAEEHLSLRRKETVAAINFAKSTILILGVVSIVLAACSAFHVASYVTGNISRVASAMKRLAEGDRKSTLPRSFRKRDEIGDLFRSFRTFRANALRLDRSNSQLHQRNALLEKVFNNMSDGVAVTDETGKIRYLNQKFSQVLGNDGDLFARGTICDALRTYGILREPDTDLDVHFQGSAELRSGDGQVLTLRANQLPENGRVWLLTDITESRKVDERLNQIRRIEALGKVTGEVAHDFGNILSSISTNLHLLETRDDAQNAACVRTRIANAVEIGTSLTQRLLAFAKKQQLVPEIVELNSLVEGVLDLISIGLKDGVQLETDCGREPVYVKADPGQLESAIFNLCLNANQAISETGEIRVKVHVDMPASASITVADNGSGMDEVTLTQAMEPFFTSRDDGEGTGLGLSMVYGFIKQTGGDIKIKSQLGKGTSVQISLPICSPPVTERWTNDRVMRALVIDDDSHILKSIGRDLEQLSFSTTLAASFDSARKALAENAPFDLVCTDLQLENGTSGWDLAEQALKANMSTHVCVISGRLPGHHPILTGYPSRVTCFSKPASFEDIQKLNIRLRASQN
ncbi:ATP-binding protein [Roseibium sp. M-1]